MLFNVHAPVVGGFREGLPPNTSIFCGTIEVRCANDALLAGTASSSRLPIPLFIFRPLHQSLPRHGKTGMEPASGVCFPHFASVITQDLRWPGPEMPVHRSHMAADVMRQVDVIVLPDNQNLALRQSSEGIELLRQ